MHEPCMNRYWDRHRYRHRDWYRCRYRFRPVLVGIEASLLSYSEYISADRSSMWVTTVHHVSNEQASQVPASTMEFKDANGTALTLFSKFFLMTST